MRGSRKGCGDHALPVAVHPASCVTRTGFGDRRGPQTAVVNSLPLRGRIPILEAPGGDRPTSDASEFDGVLTVDEMVRYVRSGGPDGLAAILKHYGTLNARLVTLRIALEDRLAQPRVKNHPPAVFVAYKWEKDAHNAWVHALAEELKRRGYDVLLDQDHLEHDASNYDAVPSYIARLVDCDFCLVVVTERYLDLVEARHDQTSWVFDEYQVATELHMQGRLQILAVLKEATVRPGKLLLRLNSIDMRNQAPGDYRALEAHFPAYEGPSLTVSERQALLAFAQRFDGLMAADEPDAQALQQTLMEHEAFEPLYDYKLRLAQLYWRAGVISKAYPVALAIRHECPNDDDIMLLAQVFDAAQDYPTLFKFLHTARNGLHLRDSVIYHYFVAETLFEHNSFFAARNHFRWLERSPAFENMPAHLRDEISHRIRTIDESIGMVVPDHTFHCTACGARYPHAGDLNAVCGDCGTLYESIEARCPLCSNDGRVPLSLLLSGESTPIRILCPICDEGEMAFVA
jgi:TIR domain